jgi:hypothetical protein
MQGKYQMESGAFIHVRIMTKFGTHTLKKYQCLHRTVEEATVPPLLSGSVAELYLLQATIHVGGRGPVALVLWLGTNCETEPHIWDGSMCRYIRAKMYEISLQPQAVPSICRRFGVSDWTHSKCRAEAHRASNTNRGARSQTARQSWKANKIYLPCETWSLIVWE